MKPTKNFAALYWPIIVFRYSLLTFLLFASSGWGDIRLAPNESYTQEGAGEYCRSLGEGWHLMRIETLYAHADSLPFNLSYSYWTSSETRDDNTELGTGSAGDGGKIPMLGYSYYPKERNITLSPPWKRISAACTNEVEPKRIREYRQTSEGTVDGYSQILWHSLDATDKHLKYTYENAKDMCDNLSLFGRSWRLPTTKELYGIVDYDFSRPTVDMTFFGPMMQRYYWTSESLNTQEAYVVGFKLGGVATAPKKESAHVRCVSEY